VVAILITKETVSLPSAASATKYFMTMNYTMPLSVNPRRNLWLLVVNFVLPILQEDVTPLLALLLVTVPKMTTAQDQGPVIVLVFALLTVTDLQPRTTNVIVTVLVLKIVTKIVPVIVLEIVIVLVLLNVSASLMIIVAALPIQAIVVLVPVPMIVVLIPLELAILQLHF
jgi:hypothetical protein